MKKLLIFLSLFIWGNTILQAEIPKKPIPPRLVNDYMGLLSQQEQQSLEVKLSEFARQTSNQIVVLIVDDLDGYDVSEYAFKVGESWGVGNKEFDNGIVIVVKPSGGEGQRKTFITTGYGLEGAIPDAVTKRIVEHEMIPYFKNNNFYGGIDKATTVLMQLAQKEFSSEVYLDKTKPKFGSSLIIILIFVIIMIFSSFSRARTYSRANHLPFWTALMLMGSAGRSHSSGYSNFSSGGGGFGGFGGGGFGGGGAGGSW